MIHDNGDDTYTVTLYQGGKPVNETVDGQFPTVSVNALPWQDTSNGVKEIWPQIVEKANAQLNGGYSEDAMMALTGGKVAFFPTRGKM
jgi:hypothetical protein